MVPWVQVEECCFLASNFSHFARQRFGSDLFDTIARRFADISSISAIDLVPFERISAFLTNGRGHFGCFKESSRVSSTFIHVLVLFLFFSPCVFLAGILTENESPPSLIAPAAGNKETSGSTTPSPRIREIYETPRITARG